ncbi:hypothetical protein BJV78DRAFT_1228690 [Lactifluus subvellereus]|nr:hypothetical protein BJV78DRAFT_1228690 [Lactifluus subvellereus]
MSRLAILAPLLLLSGIAVAQINVPGVICSQTWQWTSNSFGQNPCIVAAYLMATCNGGYDGDLCKCNTVVYSLLSACDACQQKPWIMYVP